MDTPQFSLAFDSCSEYILNRGFLYSGMFSGYGLFLCLFGNR